MLTVFHRSYSSLIARLKKGPRHCLSCVYYKYFFKYTWPLIVKKNAVNARLKKGLSHCISCVYYKYFFKYTWPLIVKKNVIKARLKKGLSHCISCVYYKYFFKYTWPLIVKKNVINARLKKGPRHCLSCVYYKYFFKYTRPLIVKKNSIKARLKKGPSHCISCVYHKYVCPVTMQVHFVLTRLKRAPRHYFSYFYNTCCSKCSKLMPFKIKLHSILNYFTIGPIIGNLRPLLKSGGIEAARLFLKKHYFFFRPAYAKFLFDLYGYLLNSTQPPNGPDPSKKDFIIHFCCWGKSYTDKAIHYLLASMLAKGNLPAISQKYNVLVFIHGDSTMAAELEKSKAVEHIKEYASFYVDVIPNRIMRRYKAAMNYPNFLLFKQINRANHSLKYFFLGALQSHALNIGMERKAVVSFLMPDIVLSDAFFSCGATHIEGKKLILASSFRTDFYSAQFDLDQFRHEKDRSCLSIPAASLAKIQVKHLHVYDERRVISEKTEHFVSCARFIFKTSQGLILRALHYHPILMNCSEISQEIKADYLPIDDSVLKQVLTDDLPFEQQVWFSKDTSLMNFAELSGSEPMVTEPPLLENMRYKYEDLVNVLCEMIKGGAADFNRHINRFFIQNKTVYNLSDNYHHESDVINDHDFIKDVYQRVDQQIPIIED